MPFEQEEKRQQRQQFHRKALDFEVFDATRKMQGKHAFQEAECLNQGSRAEENPGDQGQKERKTHSRKVGKRRQNPVFCDDFKVIAVAVRNQKRQKVQGVEESPKNVGPIGAMPESADEENEEGVSDLHPHTATASAKRYI